MENNPNPLNRVLTISGGGFDAVTPENNRVQLNGQDLAILAVTPTTLRAALPRTASPGRVRVSNRHGSAWSSQPLTGMPLELSLTPGEAALPAGATQTFSALLNGRRAQDIEWSVNGTPGGSAEAGFISRSGEYVAPDVIPSDRTVIISANVGPELDVATHATVLLLPPTPVNGSGVVAARQGGTVIDADGRAAVQLPPDALSVDATVSLRLLEGPERPAARPGSRVLAAFDFSAQAVPVAVPRAGLQSLNAVVLRAPALVNVPLANSLPPGGNPIPNLQVAVEGAPLQAVPAVVSDDGNSLNLLMPSFGVVTIFMPVLEVQLPPPVLGQHGCDKVIGENS